MKKPNDIPTTNPTEIEALIKRVEESPLAKGDKDLIARLLQLVLMLLRMVESKKAEI